MASVKDQLSNNWYPIQMPTETFSWNLAIFRLYFSCTFWLLWFFFFFYSLLMLQRDRMIVILQGILATSCICNTQNCNQNETDWCACPRDLKVCQQCGGAGLAGKDDFNCRSIQDNGVSAYCSVNQACFYHKEQGKMTVMHTYKSRDFLVLIKSFGSTSIRIRFLFKFDWKFSRT